MLERAERVLRIEAEAVSSLIGRLDGRFEQAVGLLLGCRGRVMVCGMGKSGLIGKKIAATLASTGTPAAFLHPAEGSHGDLGMITRDDLLLALSNSGETAEVLALLPVIKRLGVKIIALVGRMQSALAHQSDVVLDVSVAQEACSLGLAPTASTTAALAMGDALAVVLLEQRGFGPEEFALLHPGGSLGRKLLLKVSDLMHGGERIPLVLKDQPMMAALLEMTSKRFGMTGVTDGERLLGIITDGDLRRCLFRDERLLERTAAEIMTANPRTIGAEALAATALHMMEEYKITTLFIVDEKKRPQGVIHLHDLLRAGVI